MSTVQLIYRVSNSVGFALSLLLNSLLLWLIRKRSPQELRTYSLILTQTCVVDLIYALALVLAMPLIIVVDGQLVILSVGWLAWIPLPANFCLVMSPVVIYIFAFSALGVQFLYRYFVSIHGTRLTHRQYAAMLVVPLALASLAAVLEYIASYPSLELLRHTAEVVGPMLGVPNEEVVPFLGNKSDSQGRALAFLNATVFGTTTGTYALIIWCIYKVGPEMEEFADSPNSELPLPSGGQTDANHKRGPYLHAGE